MIPFWQKEVLRSAVSAPFGQTYELDLPKSGHLGSLVLYLSATAVSNYFLTPIKWRLIDWISKIEVIADGSQVIKSFDGRQALASAFYDDFREPVGMHRSYATTPQRQWIPIHFGRSFLDEVYGLDLSRYNQVTLKITNDASTDVFATAFALTVVAYWLREVVSPFVAHLREEEWKTYLPVSDSWEYNELPVALPIRRILLRARPAWTSADAKAAGGMHDSMDDIEFTFLSGQTRVFRGPLATLGHLSVMEMPCLAEARGQVDRTQGYGFETGVGYVTNNMGVGMPDADGRTGVIANMRMDVQNSAQESGYRAGEGALSYVVRGHGYGHCVPLYYARKPDLADLLIPNDVKQVDCNIHALSGGSFDVTGTDAENAIILSRIAP